VVVCSVTAQLQSLPWIWRSIEARCVLPFYCTCFATHPAWNRLLSHLDARVRGGDADHTKFNRA